MKKCELCNSRANMYCESDQASLCWNCDANVHAANFLVSKHSRTLLCHVCQSPTPWHGSGPKLGPTVSFCQACVNSGENDARRLRNDEDHADEDDNDRETDDDEEEDDEENQVVPWSCTPQAPSVSSSSTSEECANRFYNSRESITQWNIPSSMKLRHSTANLRNQNDQGYFSSQSNQRAYLSNESTSVDSSRSFFWSKYPPGP